MTTFMEDFVLFLDILNANMTSDISQVTRSYDMILTLQWLKCFASVVCNCSVLLKLSSVVSN